VRDPEAARASLHEGPEGFEIPEFLAALTEIVAHAADRPPHPYGLAEGLNGVVLAAPPLAAKKAEAAWNKAWPGHKPNLVSFEAEYDRIPYDEAEGWLGVLRRQPAALDNLSILDDLALLVEPIADGPVPALSDTLLAPLLARALALIRASLAGAEDRRLEWAHVENRPALRLLSLEARRLDQAGRAADAAALYAWLLRLNPNDNHGHREWVINHHLRSGANQAALDVATAYPKDFLAPTVFGRALALWRLGPREAAEPVLRCAADDRPLVVRALLAEEMTQPESDPNGLAIGGEEEAWIYRVEMREAWQATPDALDYLRGLPRAPARGSRRARKTRKGR
jgi:hypothetical protein